jgi:hypothetical protein
MQGNEGFLFRIVSIVYYMSDLENPISGHYYCCRKNDDQWLRCDDIVCASEDNIDENFKNAYFIILEKI